MSQGKQVKHDGVTTTAYFAGCRCDLCRQAGAAYFKRRKEAKKAAAAPPIPISGLFARMRPQHPHTHRWRFAEPSGPTVTGRCSCGRSTTRPSSSYHEPQGRQHLVLKPVGRPARHLSGVR